MAPRSEKRNRFFTPDSADTATFAVNANRKYPFLQKSVAVIGVRKDGKQICLLKPRKVAADIRVPPQGRIQNADADPAREAQRVVYDKVGLMIDRSQFRYLGYGFTDRHRKDGTVTPNGKLLHWLCAGFGDDPQIQKTFSKNEYSEAIDWWHVEGILGQMADIGMMTPRKLYLLESAILEMPQHHPSFKAAVFQDLATAV